MAGDEGGELVLRNPTVALLLFVLPFLIGCRTFARTCDMPLRSVL